MDEAPKKWTLITGASSGMGADFARQLAAKGYSLALTARRREAMEALAKEIRSARPDTGIEIIDGDLASKDCVARILEATKPLDIEILVNNAGFGAYGPFESIPEEAEETMIAVDVLALMRLTKAFALRMKARGRGFILETASIGAFQPCPLYGSYGAAKAFVLNYGLAVRQELKGSGVGLTVLCPGVTRTGFFDAAKQKNLSKFQESSMADSATVVRGAVKALFGGKAIYVPGAMNALNAFATRFVSRPLAAAVAQGLMAGKE
jgi:short-subunit dehydrogenase